MYGVGRSLQRKTQHSHLCAQVLQGCSLLPYATTHRYSDQHCWQCSRWDPMPLPATDRLPLLVFYPVPPLMQPCFVLALLPQMQSRQRVPRVFPKEIHPQHIKSPSSSFCWMLALFRHIPQTDTPFKVNYSTFLHIELHFNLLAESLKRLWLWWICLGCAQSWGELTPIYLLPQPPAEPE